VLQFRPRTLAPGPGQHRNSNEAANDLSRYERDREEPDDFRHRMLANVAAFAFTIALLVIAYGSRSALRTAQNPGRVLMGRRDCVRISTPHSWYFRPRRLVCPKILSRRYRPPPLNSGQRSDIRALDSGWRIGHSGRSGRLPHGSGIYRQYIKGLVMSSTFDQVATIIAETCDPYRATTITPKVSDRRSRDRQPRFSRHRICDRQGVRDQIAAEKWTQEVNDGKATTEQYFVLKNLSARIDEWSRPRAPNRPPCILKFPV